MEFSPPRLLDQVLKDLKQQRQIALALALPASAATSSEEEEEPPDTNERGRAGAAPTLVPLGQLILDDADLSGGAAGPQQRQQAAAGSSFGGDLAVPVPMPQGSRMGSGLPGATGSTVTALPGAGTGCLGIALSWSHTTCVFLHLGGDSSMSAGQQTGQEGALGGAGSTSSSEAEVAVCSYLSKVWEAVRALLADKQVAKCCFASRQQIGALMALYTEYIARQQRGSFPAAAAAEAVASAGDQIQLQRRLVIAGPLLDAQVMRWSSSSGCRVGSGGAGPAEGLGLGLKAVLRAAIAEYALLVPMHEHDAIRRACR